MLVLRGPQTVLNIDLEPCLARNSSRLKKTRFQTQKPLSNTGFSRLKNTVHDNEISCDHPELA